MRVMLRAAAIIVLALAALLPAGARAEEGWGFRSYSSDVTIRADGTVTVDETFVADFGSLERHGIYRDLRTRFQCAPVKDGPEPLFPCPGGKDRVYEVAVESVTGEEGLPIPYTMESIDRGTRIKIGDPNRTVTGVQTYRIRYTVRGALNAFESHDELYWNVLSNMPVATAAVRVRVSLPAAPAPAPICYQGPYGSRERCTATTDGNLAVYTATRQLGVGDGLTVVAGWQHGVVAVEPPLLKDRLSIDDFFTFDVLEFGGALVLAALTLLALGRTWWRYGRDRAYKSLYYLTNDPREGTRSLFARTDIVIEYLPPEGLRPAEMGVILDERADTLDVTATIIDLAVRGHLHITEVAKQGWLGKGDWELEKKENPGDELVKYEQKLLDALFESREQVKVSSLKNKFAEDLRRVKDELYKDALNRKWFSRNPETTRTYWLVAGLAVAGVGAALVVAAGGLLERALIPVPIVLGGLLMLPLSRAMSRRTATGSEALRRVLGFRLYVATAEKRLQEFNEQRNIFARYLPFAMVFGCVDKWAKAFDGMDEDARASTAAWYSGVRPFEVMAFTSGMRGFAGTVSSSIASTPGSSGGSGFSGGFSGGGGGGGGAGSW